MRAVKSAGNASTELRLARLLREHKLSGWRRHWGIPGRPDFAWPAHRVALFVDGCFWHGCPHCNRPMPVASADYWRGKIERNKARDNRTTRQLRRDGWAVLRVWEHSLKQPAPIVARIRRALAR